MPVDWMENGLAAMFAANNPDAFATYAAAKGMPPPDGAVGGMGGAGGASLAGLLDPQPQSPFAGVQIPEAPQAQIPGAPAAPGQMQAIQPGTELMKLLAAARPGAGAVPSLAPLLGR